jgi:hypothetical protein
MFELGRDGYRRSDIISPDSISDAMGRSIIKAASVKRKIEGLLYSNTAL